MREKKIITVTFNDGVQQLPSSIKIKCNVTGQAKGFYTPYLVRLIKRKYDNNYQYFIDNYVSKGNKKDLIKTDSEEPPDLSLYKTTLQMEYAYLRARPRTSQNRNKMSFIKEKFGNRFPENDINEYSK